MTIQAKPLPTGGRRTRTLSRAIARFLAAAASDLAVQVTDWTKQHPDTAPSAFPTFADMIRWDPLVLVMLGALQDAGDASGLQALKQGGALGTDALPAELATGEAVDETAGQYVSRMAEFYANQRAAELVGMQYDAAGNLVVNPDALKAISDSTRAMLQQDIEDAIAQGLNADQLTALIQGNYAFSAERAALIAEYELDTAHTAATLQGWMASGKVVGKRSQVSPEHDEYDDCDVNEEAGTIPLDGAFPTGDYGTPFHLRCHCLIIGVMRATPLQAD